MALIPIVFAGVIAAGSALFGIGRRREMNESWERAADMLGLGFTYAGSWGTYPTIQGLSNGIAVLVHMTSTGSGDSKKWWTTYEVRHRDTGPPGELKRQSDIALVNWFGRLTGSSPYDVEIGDPFFDQTIIVNSAHDEAWREFLTPVRRAAVLQVFETWKRVTMTNGRIMVADQGHCTDTDRIVQCVRYLLDVAATLEGNALAAHALAMQDQGHLGAAVDAWHRTNTTQAPNSFTEVLEAEARVETGDHEGARPLLNHAEQWSLDDVVGGWQEVAERPSPEMPDEPRPVNFDADSVIADLFGSNLLSWDIVDRFERRWFGRTVTWSGQVVSASTFADDYDFGAGPGTRVIVTVGHVDGMRLISNQVDAVVGLQGEHRIAHGQQVTFSGTLSKIDRFARKLYVADARLG